MRVFTLLAALSVAFSQEPNDHKILPASTNYLQPKMLRSSSCTSSLIPPPSTSDLQEAGCSLSDVQKSQCLREPSDESDGEAINWEFFEAFENRDTSLLSRLVEKHGNDIYGDYIEQAFLLAAEQNSGPLMESLLEQHGKQIDADVVRQGVGMAFKRGHRRVVELLLEKRGESIVIDGETISKSFIILVKNDPAAFFVEFVLKNHGEQIGADAIQEGFDVAFKEGHIWALQVLLENRAEDITIDDATAKQIFILSVEQDYDGLVKALLKKCGEKVDMDTIKQGFLLAVREACASPAEPTSERWRRAKEETAMAIFEGSEDKVGIETAETALELIAASENCCMMEALYDALNSYTKQACQLK